MFEVPIGEPFINYTEAELRARIRQFRRLNLREISDWDLRDKLADIFLFPTSDAFDSCYIPQQHEVYAIGTEFFRARALAEDDNRIPLKIMKHVRDAWEPPEERVMQYGRVHRPHQSILYTCLSSAKTTMDEARIAPEQFFCMMVYVAQENVRVRTIGPDLKNLSMSEVGRAKMEIYHDFLETEFSRDVEDGSEHLYRLSQAIAEDFYFAIDPHALVYRSMKDKTKFNCAFLPDHAKSCLRLRGALYCRRDPAPGEDFTVGAVVTFDKSSGQAIYHQIGSPVQKEIFPEIGA